MIYALPRLHHLPVPTELYYSAEKMHFYDLIIIIKYNNSFNIGAFYCIFIVVAILDILCLKRCLHKTKEKYCNA